MGFYVPSHIFGATITDFDSVAIENFMQFIWFREVFVDKLEEGMGNISWYILVEWWVEP